jgi:hypothetical protein
VIPVVGACSPPGGETALARRLAVALVTFTMP